jgi:predicted DNA-binding transcriptional regulator YafY
VTPSHRTATLLLHLVRHRTLTARQAADLCGCTLRQARSDLKALAAVAPVRFVAANRHSHWVLDVERGLGPLDRISLLVGREVTRFLEGTSLHRGLERLRELHPADDALTARVRYLSEPARAYAPRDEIVDACLDGLLRTRTLTFVYDAPSGRDRFEGAEPLTLVVYKRALYLLARLGHGVYTFAVDRVAEVEVGAPFAYPTDWDVDAWLGERFGITAGDGPPEDVILRFSARVAHLVRARRWHATQRLSELADGDVLLHFRAKGSELVPFVLGWGELVEVLAPKSLRDRVVGELEHALSRYRRDR